MGSWMGSWLWELPGPARFLSRVAASAGEDGGSACLGLPATVPDGLINAIAHHIRTILGTRVLVADASQGLGARGPVHWLAARASVAATGIRSVTDFLDEPSMADVVFVVHSMPRKDWREWSGFLRLLRTERSRTERMTAPVIVLVPPPGVSRQEIVAIFGKRESRWIGRVTRLDTEIAADRALGWKGGEDLASRVATACVVEVSGWDLRMVEALAALPQENQMSPLEALRAEAWKLPPDPPTWDNGLVDLWDGAPFEHTLSLIRRGREADLDRRLWRAQMRTAFPFLERVQATVIAHHRKLLAESLAENPLRKEYRGGRTKDILVPEELESWDLLDRLRSRIPASDEAFLQVCHRLRNCLAHMKPAPEHFILRLSRYWEENAYHYMDDCHGWDWPRSGQKLVLMIGPSGAGKSRWADIVSSDEIRVELHGSMDMAGDQGPVFDQVRKDVVARLENGQNAVIDATNLVAADRISNARLAPVDFPVEYIVIDRPMDLKLRDAGWRAAKPWLLEKHAKDFAAGVEMILAGDGLANVRVFDMRQDPDGAASSLEPKAA